MTLLNTYLFMTPLLIALLSIQIGYLLYSRRPCLTSPLLFGGLLMYLIIGHTIPHVWLWVSEVGILLGTEWQWLAARTIRATIFRTLTLGATVWLWLILLRGCDDSSVTQR